MQHIVAHVRSMDRSVVMPFAKHLPKRMKQVEKVEEGFMWTLSLPTHTHTHTHTHTRDSQGWQRCVAIPLAKHPAGTTGKVEKANVLSIDSVRKEDGRKLDKFYVIICMNATQLEVQFIIHFLHVSSGYHFHTRAFRSLLCVFCVLTTVHVTPVTSHQHAPHHGYNAVAGDCGAGSHLLRTNRHSLPTKWVEKVGKLKYCGST